MARARARSSRAQGAGTSSAARGEGKGMGRWVWSCLLRMRDAVANRPSGLVMSQRTRNRWIAPAAVLVLALMFVPPPRQLLNVDPLLDQIGMSDDVREKIMSRLGDKVGDLTKASSEYLSEVYAMLSEEDDESRPGRAAANSGLRKKYPVAIIPGATTTGLEIWQGKPCAKASFKQRLWGTMSMFSSLASMEAPCWLEHMSLDPWTGLDPEGIKVRPAQGLDNVEYIIPGFWVWAKVVESLADIGYDASDLYAFPYDWRLSPAKLQLRDGLMTRLKHGLEASLETHGMPACVVSHSYGDSVFRYFLSWVESDQGGRGGSGWVERHIRRYVVIGAPMLGLPKALTAVLTGDTSDSIWMPDLASFLTSKSIMTRAGRGHWFKTMGSGASLLPWGGEAIWGSARRSPDDLPGERGEYSYGSFLCLLGGTAEGASLEVRHEGRNCSAVSVTGALALLNDTGGEAMRANFGIGPVMQEYAKPRVKGERSTLGKAAWGHALLDPLPRAPSLKIFCLYGVDVPTERSYVLRYDEATSSFAIDKSVTDPAAQIELGVQSSDGDGTVPLVSLGYMCHRGWRQPHLNPSSVVVKTKEYKHQALKLSLRGGPKVSDHVNILGNTDVLMDVLRAAAGEDIEEEIHSDIAGVSARVGL